MPILYEQKTPETALVLLLHNFNKLLIINVLEITEYPFLSFTSSLFNQSERLLDWIFSCNTCMHTSVFLSSPSWDKASYVDSPIWKVGVDTTLSVRSDKENWFKKYLWSKSHLYLWSSFNPEF